ncbi:hypothetical protein BGW80DRAFT_1419420 [Lactifluus volemus]|jgi:hypothetical protein|nr:hypothetical protein BGW80DRAFT_1419420 [Lactifluus volemus]
MALYAIHLFLFLSLPHLCLPHIILYVPNVTSLHHHLLGVPEGFVTIIHDMQPVQLFNAIAKQDSPFRLCLGGGHQFDISRILKWRIFLGDSVASGSCVVAR